MLTSSDSCRASKLFGKAGHMLKDPFKRDGRGFNKAA